MKVEDLIENIEIAARTWPDAEARLSISTEFEPVLEIGVVVNENGKSRFKQMIAMTLADKAECAQIKG